MLDAEFPLAYTILEGASNRQCYLDFVAQDVVSHAKPNDTILGDNLNYHFKGETGALAFDMISSTGANYVRIPTYSLELNPSEKVFSFLKKDLKNCNIYDDVVSAITKSLAKITIWHMYGWYRCCGYL